ncbi:hypothetical protein ACGFLT_14335 [Micromonospora chalcea]|uniref:hypothetical protein n=1 Tax=Micromonospora sp. B006 TaxID=2201999 RepID=UPI000E2FFFA7|nr:hypothetical protein [Micromonospora sp. B006]AXO36290.1 hypothetical protein MicB006_4020 [Micromonospora sp. B006]
MTGESPRGLGLGPFLVALLGAVVIAFLLLMPVRIGPGDHEKNTSCGNALVMDLNHWRDVPDYPDRAYYLDMANRSCSDGRADRAWQAAAVLVVTLIGAVGLQARHAARREQSVRSGGEPPRHA